MFTLTNIYVKTLNVNKQGSSKVMTEKVRDLIINAKNLSEAVVVIQDHRSEFTEKEQEMIRKCNFSSLSVADLITKLFDCSDKK